MNLFFDRQGQPIEVLEWADHFADIGYRTVGRDRVGNYEVITMWMGTDQALFPGQGDDPPEIFGTIIRAGERGYLDNTEKTSATEEEALATHAAMIALANALDLGASRRPDWTDGEVGDDPKRGH